MNRIFVIVLALSSLCFAQGGTTSRDLLPANTGQNLGADTQRWDVFAQDVDMNGVFTYSGVPIIPASTSAANAWAQMQTFNGGLASSGNLVFPTGTSYAKASSFLYNGVNSDTEFHAGQAGVSGQDGVGFGAIVPVTATTFQTNVLASYAQSQGSTSFVTAGYFSARANANNSHLWGINPLFMDGGFSGVTGAAIEADCNHANTGTLGACVQINGGFSGVATSFPALQIAVPVGGGKWSTGIVIDPAATPGHGMVLGATSASGTAYSQDILFQGRSGVTNTSASLGSDPNGSIIATLPPSQVLSLAGTGATLRVQHNVSLVGRNVADSGDVPLIKAGPVDTVVIDDAGSGTTFVGSINVLGSGGIIFNSTHGSIDSNGKATFGSTVTATGFVGTGAPKIASGSASNTDINGILTLVAGTASYTFVNTFSSSPICFSKDVTTSTNATNETVTTTTLTVTGTGTDQVKYLCVGRN